MAQLVPHRHHPLERWLRRLDRVAGSINPFLAVVAIGLAILNLTCVVLLAPRLPITRDTLGRGVCSVAPASNPDTGPPPTGDIKAWAY